MTSTLLDKVYFVIMIIIFVAAAILVYLLDDINNRLDRLNLRADQADERIMWLARYCEPGN